MSAAPATFPCTPGGSIGCGRRRLRRLLLGLVWLMAAAAVAAWVNGRFWPGFLALAVAIVPWVAWRLASDHDLRALRLEAGDLVIEMTWRRTRIPLVEVTARRLSREETAHLETLVEAGGIAAGNGGFDSHLLGAFDLYASDLQNAVLLRIGEEQVVLTPDEPEEFIRSI